MENYQIPTQNNNQNYLNQEAIRVGLLSKAGGMVTRNLVKKGEEMLQNSNTPSKK